MTGFAHIEVRPNGDVVLVETASGVGGGSGGGSGTVDETDFNFSDITTANATTARHGLLRKLSGNSSQFLDGTGNWTTVVVGVSEALITLSDVTTDDATTSRHGFLKKLSGNANEFMNGLGNWTVVLSGVSEGLITLSDVTTDDVTITRHGFAPKAPNDLNKFLRGDGQWAVVSVSSVSTLGSDPLWDAKGDLVAGVTDNTAAILSVGATNGYGLVVDSSQTTGLKWSEILQNDPLWSAKGDLAIGLTDNWAKMLSVGATNTDVLTTDSSQELGMKWTTPRPIRNLNIVLGGAGSVVSTGISGDIEMDFDCTIVQWTVLADITGSIQIDIWKDTYGNYPPTVADSISPSGKALISSGIKNQSSILTGWTNTSISAGDTLRFNVDSASAITRATLSLKLT